MNRQEFFRELEYLLRGIPENERMDALAYYNDYFDEAGVENEQQVILELGSPQQVAASIIADYNSTRYDETRGYEAPTGYGEPSGYQDTREHEYQNTYQDYTYQQTSQNKPIKRKEEKRNKSTIILIVILLVFTFPVWIGIVAGLFGGVVGILGGLFGTGVGLLFGGAACVVVGIFKLFTMPLEGFTTVAVGSMLLAISILAILLLVLLVGKWIPMLIKWIVRLCKGLLHRQEGGDEI